MKSFNRSILCLAFLLVLNGLPVSAQQPAKPQSDDVLRINTELVQTAITVLDKNGHFVDGLERAQFELVVDDKPRSISLFERVSAGTAREFELTTARTVTEAEAAKKPVVAPTIPGRTIVFFVDDMHISADSLHRTRDMLRHFLDAEMNSKDAVAIASASGQVGFLQQFTNNKEVLNAAIERLSPKTYEARGYGSGSTKMREFDALQIDSASPKANSAILNFYIRECMVQSTVPKLIPVARAAMAASCETQVRNSARGVLMQAGTLTIDMYSSLEGLLRSSARRPGRKLAFFVSDGFLLDAGPHAPDLRGKLDSVIDAAQRGGVVVYTIDSRGLINDKVDLTQATARPDFGAPIGEIEARQDAMNAIAGDTGGRALRNMNYFDRWVTSVLDETSNYYLLAWRPDSEFEKAIGFRHVKISIVGHPELTVRAPRGFMAGPPPTPDAAASAKVVKTPEKQISDALSDFYPVGGLPTLLSLTYLNTPANGTVVTSSIQIATNALAYGEDGKQPATIRLAGVVLNDKGKIASSFRNQLNVDPRENEGLAAGIIYNHHTPLAPGIYQVRVAARDDKNGKLGSDQQWIVIPDLTKNQLTLSSLLLGGQVLEDNSNTTDNPRVQLSVDHRFSRSSPLGYWIFVYNAKRDSSGHPNLTAQTHVIRDGIGVLSSPVRKVESDETDLERIPFGDELKLKTLAPGKYDLSVTITDAISGVSVTQRTQFVVQ